MGAQKTPIQKTYEIQKGSDSLNVEFLEANRQFDWIEISTVPDKSDKHTTIYDNYNREMPAQLIKSLKLSNFTKIYSLINEKKCSTDNLIQRYLPYKQFVAWNCNGSSVVPLNEYMDNPIFQELPDENTYYSAKSDERVYLDLRANSGYVNEAENLEKNDSKIKRNNRRIYLNQAAPALRKIKRRRRNEAIKRLMSIYDRVNQSGSELASNLAKAGLELGSKALESEFGKKIINKGIDNIPNIFRFGISKIKNKNIKRAMKSDIAKIVEKEAKNRAKTKYDNLFD